MPKKTKKKPKSKHFSEEELNKAIEFLLLTRFIPAFREIGKAVEERFRKR